MNSVAEVLYVKNLADRCRVHYTSKQIFAAICLTLLLLTGCTPWISTRYEPHGTGKVYGPSGCATNDSAAMEFALGDGASLSVSAYIPTKADSVSRVGGRLILPPNLRARFGSTVLKVKTASMSEFTLVPFTQLHVVYLGSSPDGTKPGMTTIDAREIMDGGPVGSGRIERMTDFDFSVKMPFQESPDFTVIFPSIVLGARTIVFDPVRFTILTHARVIGFAC